MPIFDEDEMKPPARHEVEEMIRRQLSFIGEEPGREGLIKTPSRIIDSWTQFFYGYRLDPKAALGTVFKEEYYYDEVILLKNIEFVSMCEHHMLPFTGFAHVAYVPGVGMGVVGVSKLARLLEVYARRLQIQERLTTQVTETLDEVLQPQGAACIIEASHSCMSCRGVGKQQSRMVTSSLTGVFRSKPEARIELLQLIKG